MSDYQQETYAVKSGIAVDTQFGAVVPPIYLSTNYTFAGFGEKKENLTIVVPVIQPVAPWLVRWLHLRGGQVPFSPGVAWALLT